MKVFVHIYLTHLYLKEGGGGDAAGDATGEGEGGVLAGKIASSCSERTFSSLCTWVGDI